MGRRHRLIRAAKPRSGLIRTFLLLLSAALLGAACSAGTPSPSVAPTASPSGIPTASPSAAAASPSMPASSPSVAAPPTASATSPSATPAEAAFPVTLTDDEGTEVPLEAPPQRVISLSPANTEIVFALGAGDSLVGGTDFDDFPAEAADLPDVATFTGVLLEQVVDLDPDLVLAAGNAFTPAADIQRMRDLGFPVLVVYAATVDEVLSDIELIGQAIGRPEEATHLTAGMRDRIEEVTEATGASGEAPRVFYQIGSEPEFYGPAPGSFIADMIELAGGDPITTSDPTVFSIPVERLVTADPEIIVVGDAAYGVCPEQVAARPGWRQMTAVREGAVRPIDDTIVTRPGPRLAEGLASLAVAIYPDIELASPPPPVTFCGP